MARLLLGSAPMRPWLLLLPLVTSGCLYLDSLDQPPTVSLPSDSVTTANKGGRLTVAPVYGDPDDDVSSLRLALTVTDGQTPPQPLDPSCDYTVDAGVRAFTVTFYRVGIFKVTVTVSDRDHASNEASEMVTITDALPVFTAGATIKQTSDRDFCGLDTAGDVLTLQLAPPSRADAAVSDADALEVKPGCTPHDVLGYTWRISDAPSGTMPVLTPYDGSSCAAPTATSGPTLAVDDPKTQVCLWTDPTSTAATSMYSVVLDVTDDASDPSHTVTSPVGNIPVGADQPPCISGTEPIAGSWVVDRSELQEFTVDHVDDDRDSLGAPMSMLTFAWSVWREDDPVWREVPDWTIPNYQLDVSSFGVGEKVRVRAEAVDRSGARVPPSSCPVDADDCVVSSCASAPNVCHKWKTWDLELR